MDITYMFMLPVLEFLQKNLGNYGWAILGLTILVRILVWPLVVASTRSMQRMSLLQPKIKALQDKYKDNPQVLQSKLAEFYLKNKMNPLGGCLPLLVQFPILIALFATFTGPPFQDKPIPVKVKLIAPSGAGKTTVTINPTSSGDCCYVSKDGQIAKLVVHPGDSTLVFGRNAEGQNTEDGFNAVDFSVSASAGQVPNDFKANWRIAADPNGAMIAPDGKVTFPLPGEVTIEAKFRKGDGGVDEEVALPVTVKVLPKEEGGGGLFGGNQEDGVKEKTASSDPVELSVDGKKIKVAIEPGNSSIVAGKSMQFRVKAVDGVFPPNAHPVWHIAKDPNGASIDENGKAIFRHAGEVTVDAVIPGEAKTEPFLFVSSIGKVAKGMEFLDPKNIDLLILIVLFGVTMILSQKMMVTTPPSDPEQAAIQKQTQQMMPIMVISMFIFFPLPAGVFLYMVASNLVQTLQTWIVMRSPAPPLVDIDDDEEKKTSSGADVITVVPKQSTEEEKGGEEGENTVNITVKKKQGKKR